MPFTAWKQEERKIQLQKNLFTMTSGGFVIVQYSLDLRKIFGVAKKFLKSRSFLFQTPQNP